MDNKEFYYKQHVFCCTNERPPAHPRGSCKFKGAQVLRNYMKARVKEVGLEGVRVNTAGCLDRCELGCTMVIYPEGTWYTFASKEDIEEIIVTHLQKGERVERLLLAKDQTELSKEQAATRPPATDRY